MATQAIGQFNRLITKANDAQGAEAALDVLRRFGVSKADLKVVEKTLDNQRLPHAVREALREFVNINKSTIRGPVVTQIRKEFIRLDQQGLINWSYQRPVANFGTRLYTQQLQTPRSSKEPTFNVVVLLSPAAPNADARDPNKVSQFWVERWPSASSIAPGRARIAPQYAGPFPMPGHQAWPPPADWDPHPVALYAVVVDRAVREGDPQVVSNVLGAVRRARAKVQGGSGPQLAAMSFTASAGGAVGVGVDAILAKYETRLASAGGR
jgi:hypothetical protein